jgi:phage tail sheath protein FI
MQSCGGLLGSSVQIIVAADACSLSVEDWGVVNIALVNAAAGSAVLIMDPPVGARTLADTDALRTAMDPLTSPSFATLYFPWLLDPNQEPFPPSGAIAGIWARSDYESGVWNAPANIEVSGVSGPEILLTDDQQAGLNVPLDGRAINGIRSFVNRGTLVWGARTMDGNSDDFRYIQVRRTLIYIEQSIKIALYPLVFAPNVGATWAAVVAMISDFLTSVWQQGGLLGDKPSTAFSVECGLGSTMTTHDILTGVMIIQVTIQMVHPAEFIELTFTQQTQGT